MAKLRRIWALVLTSIVSALGFTSCFPKMYGPEQPSSNDGSTMLMYGPAPMEQFVPAQPSAEPIAEAAEEIAESQPAEEITEGIAEPVANSQTID